jgi:DNA-binding GntR family transcriptional regulator
MKHSSVARANLGIDRRTLDEKVYDRLRGAIIGGVFVPGQVLTLRTLAEDFGTSLMPVRNAVTRLAVEQALEVRPNTSIKVPRLSPAQFDEVTEIRLALEPMAARQAAGRADPAEIAALAALNAEMASADRVTYLAQNMEFHFRLYAQADRPMLNQMIQSVWLRVGPLFHTLKTTHPNTSLANHREAIAALEKGDGPAAAAAIAADIGDAAAAIRVLMEHDSGD